jgi:hypothetical protein
MHGRHKLARRRPIEPLPPTGSLAQVFDELDAQDRRRYRERPLNCSAFDAIDPATAPRTAKAGR